MSEWRFPIYRANDTQLRVQIMAALQTVGLWPMVKTEVEIDDYPVFIPENYQMIVHNSFTVSGVIEIEGELVIL